ncbi:microcompartment protein [Sporanaerobium hydrogeniformans]|uniref:Microcompartment protein n=1 Tax=Sporanaerobium hydrogeniformans TaxID=3072179 RepID=A0AC61DFV0_9FIRM|nr:BMC domain-containing protein [Sporanaerobium hydrogeniformans]PHV72119.1 microcompartment protein [Sporanaerobium hydrogeniformans]
MGKSVGLLEVYGLATALHVADAACKATNVTIEAIDKNKPANADALPVPLLIMLKFRGSVTDVTEAVEVGKRAANEIAGYVAAHVIPSPDEDLEKMLKINCI